MSTMTGACYKCKFRGTVPGDAHSCCNHPKVTEAGGAMMVMFSTKVARELNIQANAHGVRSGWFMWPANFDPAWLENCDGFEEKIS